MPRLFCRPLTEGVLPLAPEESHHAAIVLRCRPSEKVVLFDGAGREAVGTIDRVERRKVWVEAAAIQERPFELAIRVTVAVAMPKPHRQGYLIEKCTELGAAAIWPILTEHSVSKARISTVKKWKRRALEAAKQSRRAWIPTIESPCAFSDCLGRVAEFDAVSLSCVGASATPFNGFLDTLSDGDAVLAFVGPEGGWSEAERKSAIAAGAVVTVLSSTVLRTETAAVAVCAAVAGRRVAGCMHGIRAPKVTD